MPNLEIKRVTKEEASNIIDTYKPLGKFYRKENNNLYIGIDNSTGEAWTEEFKTKEELFNWL